VVYVGVGGVVLLAVVGGELVFVLEETVLVTLTGVAHASVGSAASASSGVVVAATSFAGGIDFEYLLLTVVHMRRAWVLSLVCGSFFLVLQGLHRGLSG